MPPTLSLLLFTVASGLFSVFGSHPPQTGKDIASLTRSRQTNQINCETNVRSTSLNGYDLAVAPITSAGIPVDVKSYLEILEIFDLNADEQTADLFISLTLSWNDERLEWDSSMECPFTNYMTSVDIRQSEIWIPPIDVYESIHDLSESMASAYPDGTVIWNRSGKTKSKCNPVDLNSTNFLSCDMKFAALSQGSRINYIFGSDTEEGLTFADVASQYEHFDSAPALSDMSIETTLIPGTNVASHIIHYNFYFQEQQIIVSNNCTICSWMGLEVLDDHYPEYDPEVFELPPGLSCAGLDEKVSSSLTTDSESCKFYQGIFLIGCCKNLPLASECETYVQELILSDNYNPNIAPIQKYIPMRWFEPELIPVTVYFEYMNTNEVSITDGTMDATVTIDLTWNDQRLRWNDTFPYCPMTMVRASIDPQITQIWVPEFDLKNKVEGVQNLDTSFASVFSDGLVWWPRTGKIKAVCAFTGLERFPFDELGCTLMFADGRIQEITHVHYILPDLDEALTFLESFKPQYQEYTLLKEKSTVDIVDSLNPQWEDYTFPVIQYNFVFRRATWFYIRKIVIMQMVFTYLSFGVFLLDQQSGERLGFGITVLLVIVAGDIVTAEMLPKCENVLWINRFSGLSFAWVFLALLESILVTYLYFLADIEKEAESARKKQEKLKLIENEENRFNFEGHEERPVDEASSAIPYEDFQSESDNKNQTRSLRHSAVSFLAGNVKSGQTSMTTRIKALDKFCCMFFPLSYTLYAIFMFATVKSNLWSGESA